MGVTAAAISRNAISARIVSDVLRTSRPSPALIWTSSLAPDEQSGHRVVPHHTHQRTGRAREPPDRFLIVNRECDADIGKQTNAADQIERKQAAQDRKAFQPLVAIGQE